MVELTENESRRLPLALKPSAVSATGFLFSNISLNSSRRNEDTSSRATENLLKQVAPKVLHTFAARAEIEYPSHLRSQDLQLNF